MEELLESLPVAFSHYLDTAVGRLDAVGRRAEDQIAAAGGLHHPQAASPVYLCLGISILISSVNITK